jgi:hydrogenase maturation protein HypF
VTSFEGQAAMALEFAADHGDCPDFRGEVRENGTVPLAPDCSEAYPLPLVAQAEEPAMADWEPLVREVLRDRRAGVPIQRISARFHNALAELALSVARRVGLRRVALSGGCFQNALLQDCVERRLLDEGYDVLAHREVPPGDGGIALGQLWIARNRVRG